MSVSESQAKLGEAGKELLIHWQQLKQVWRDDNSRHFEQRYIAAIERELRKSDLALKQMGTMINQCRHECKDQQFG